MNSTKMIIVAVCMWAGVQFADAVPQHDFPVTHTPREEMDQISGRFMTFTITKLTKTSRTTSTLTSIAYNTCTSTVGASLAMCPTTRARRTLPFTSTQTARSHPSYDSGSPVMSNASQESDIEVGYMLLPSYIDKDCFTPRGRFFFNWVTVQSTTTITSTKTSTSTNLGTTVSLMMTAGCIPAILAGKPSCT